MASSDNESQASNLATTAPFSKVSFVEATSGDAGQRIDNFLLRLFRQVPKSHVYRVLRKGEVRVNGKRAKPETRLVEGDRVRLPPIRVDAVTTTLPPSRSLQAVLQESIIFEDADFMVINKPAGIALHGGSGLAHGVIEALRVARPELIELELVHRLDRETSGCLLIAKRRAALRALHAMFREREMDKRYLALLAGRWTLGTKILDMPLVTNQKQGGERMVRVHPEGQAAESTFQVLERYGKHATLMEVHLGTGRTHQIRVHAAYAGHPVAGDEKYGDKQANDELKSFGLRRMFLHAHSLSFVRPVTGEAFTISAPLDPELQRVLTRLGEKPAAASSQ
jgi:23S rRNA pseudouridine955/2504/2580 synthase